MRLNNQKKLKLTKNLLKMSLEDVTVNCSKHNYPEYQQLHLQPVLKAGVLRPPSAQTKAQTLQSHHLSA